MKIETYIDQKQQLGQRLHKSGGIWWQQISQSYCEPAFEFMVLDDLERSPRWSESIVGYKYFVSNLGISSSRVEHMFLDWNTDEAFGLNHLSSKKRNQVRKGLKQCDIRLLDSLDDYWTDLQRINMSNSVRTQSGMRSEYYVKRYATWKSNMQRWHALKDRQWFGAFVGETLVAYFYGYAVGNTYFINAAKSDTAYLRSNPNDALLFSILGHALNVEKCSKVEYGGYTPSDPSLSKFKEQYGFSNRTLGLFRKIRRPFKMLHGLKKRIRR